MYKNYFLIVLCYSLFSQGQDKNGGGVPAQGVTAVERTDFVEYVKEDSDSDSEAGISVVAASRSVGVGASEAGATGGALSVSLTGAAGYEIPIIIPPGINGVVPSVSLSYNSQAGNGMAGYGWNISGLGSITRVGSTMYHDGAISAVNFTASDRFALNGQRLVLKSGVYGKDGAEYETEGFSNIKITSHGLSPHGPTYGPAYFMIYYPDGSKASYGYTNVISPLGYAINYWENAQGIRISYAYTLSENTLSISRIYYGGFGDFNKTNEIQFVYRTRQKPEQSFVGGGHCYRANILSEIKVISGGVGFRNYSLSHDVNPSGYERLVSVQERSGDNSRAYSPIVFVYQNTESSSFANDATSTMSISNVNFTNASMVSGDFSGNGRMDFIIYPTIGAGAKSKYWLFTDLQNGNSLNFGFEHNVGWFTDIFPVSWLNHNNKLMPAQGWTVVQERGDKVDFNTYSTGSTGSIYFQYKKEYTFPKLVYYNEHPLSCIQPSRPPIRNEVSTSKRYISGDFNGDGLTDVIVMENATHYIKNFCDYYNNSKTAQVSDPGRAYFVNLDRRLTSNFVTYLGTSPAEENSKIMVADVNGDGKADILVFTTEMLRVYTLNSSNTGFEFICSYWDRVIDLSKPILLGDYNGDGKIDFVIPQAVNQNDWNFYFSIGVGFTKKQTKIADLNYLESKVFLNTTVNAYALSEVHYIPNDYNGDGKTDILFHENITAVGANYPGKKDGDPLVNIIRIFENEVSGPNGVRFVGKTKSTQFQNIYKHAIPIFLNNEKRNHHLEYALVSNNKILHFRNEKDNREDVLLRQVIDGNGVSERISYKPLVSDYREQHYTPSIGIENFPNVDIGVAPSFKVVSRIEHKHGEVTKQQDFKYYGAVAHTQGMGFLGFRSLLKTDWYVPADGPKVYDISNHSPALRGAIVERYRTLNRNGYFWGAPSSFISKSVFSYKTELLWNKVFKNMPTTSLEFDGINNTNATTTTVYDLYGNATKVTAVIKEGAVVKATTVVDASYSNGLTDASYYVGRPISKKESITANGDTRTSEEQYTYMPSGLLTQIKKKGHQTDFVTESNEYDIFGNVVKKTITAAGIAPRVSQYVYDGSGRFLVISKDIEGLESKYEYQTTTGLLTKETNPYGLVTQYFYDAWGKPTKVIDYLGKSTATTYAKNNGVVTITEKGDDGGERSIVYDALGRTVKEGVKNGGGKWSYRSYEYDIYDRVVRESDPYFGSAPSLWNRTQYDIYGRPTTSTAITGRTTNMTYAPLKVTVDDGVKTTITTKDAIGNVVSVTDLGGTINYTYYADGGLKTTTYDKTVITQEQDGWGRKTKLVDPSAGTYVYKYNGIGELVEEVTPKGKTVFTLDDVGKVITESIKGDLTDMAMTYTYDATTKLLTKLKGVSAGETTEYNYAYDDYKRMYQTVEQTPFFRYQKTHVYDAFGRVERETYASTVTRSGKSVTKSVKNTYRNGFHWQIVDGDTGKVLWQEDVTNARGQLEKATLGNGVVVSNAYDAYGFATSIKHDKTGGANVMLLGTSFNALKGTLNSRTSNLFSKNENFQYDNLNRLTGFTNLAGKQEQQVYDEKGRITKNNLGSYDYDNGAKIYQHTGIAFDGGTTKTDSFVDGMENRAGWTTWALNLNDITYDASRVKTGKYSLKMSTPKRAVNYVHSNQSLIINNVTDTQYTFSGWVYTDNPTAQIVLFMDREGEAYKSISSVSTTVKNQWVYITKTVSVPASIKKLNLRLDNVGNGNVWFDDVQIIKEGGKDVSEAMGYYAVRAGIYSEGMEDQRGWTTWALNLNDISYDVSRVKTGKYSLKMSTPGRAANYVHSDKIIDIDNLTNTSYTFSGWVYTDNPTAQIVLFMDREGEAYKGISSVSTTVKNQWVYLTKTVSVPANIKKLNLRLDNVGNGNVWFDDLEIRRTNDPTTKLRQLNITYNTFKSPVEIEETGVDRVGFKYNPLRGRSSVFYGGLEANALQRSGRKHYSADGALEIKENIVTGKTEFVIFVGGDAYSAPLVLKNNGTKNEYYYLHRDYLGSIVAISNEAGTVVEKRHFDPWGNVQGNLNILDRGYTGHEHLESVGLVHMNGRLYDPKVRRFLQPDNFIQNPFDTQNYNRYSYVLNNPLMYSDPSGEWFLLDDIIAGVIGGTLNLATNIFQGNIKGNVWQVIGQGSAAFGAGAAAGALSLYGPAGWAAGGAIVGGTNAWLSGADPIQGAFMGAVTGLVGGYIGQAIGGSINSIVLNNMKITSPILSGSIGGGLGGGVTGSVMSFSLSLAKGDSFNDALKGAGKAFGPGFATGGIAGGAGAYANARANGINGFNGRPLVAKEIGAQLPVGRSGNVLEEFTGVTRNESTTIKGTKFTGHALDQMQARGILSPSSVLDVIKNPAQTFQGNRPGTTIFIRDNLKVVTNKSGDVMTVIWQ